MSVQPGIGPAYPDGGKVASYHGATIVNNDSRTITAGGSFSYPITPISSWESLNIGLRAVSGTVTLDISWFYDSAGLLGAGSTEYVAIPGTLVVDSVPNLGPYVQLTLRNFTGVSAQADRINVVARQGHAYPSMIGNQPGLIMMDSTIPAGNAPNQQSTVARSGAGVVSGLLNASGMFCAIAAVQPAGTQVNVWSTIVTTGPYHFAEPLIVPPYPLIATISNGSGGAALGRCYLNLDRH
jgi:hypothetical protein